MQQVDVQRMALDPLAAVQQVAKVADRRVERGAAGRLDRLARAHLVGDRADAADAGRDVGRFGVGAAAQEALEESRWFEDAQSHIVDLALADLDDEPTLALHAGQRLHLEAARAVVVRHGRCSPGWSVPSSSGVASGRLRR